MHKFCSVTHCHLTLVQWRTVTWHLFSDALSPDTCSVNTSEYLFLTKQIIINPQLLFPYILFGCQISIPHHEHRVYLQNNVPVSYSTKTTVFYNSTHMNTSNNSIFFFNFNLFCVRLIHRGYVPSDMELVNTETKATNIIHDVRYNTINCRIHLSRRHSDYNVIAEGLY
jgi:uncharacterized membrane protein